MSTLVEVIESTGRLAIDEPIKAIACTCGNIIARTNDAALITAIAPVVVDLKTGDVVIRCKCKRLLNVKDHVALMAT